MAAWLTTGLKCFRKLVLTASGFLPINIAKACTDRTDHGGRQAARTVAGKAQS